MAITDKKVSVAALLSEKKEEWGLRALAGRSQIEQRQLSTPDINRPGMALAGYTGVFLTERV